MKLIQYDYEPLDPDLAVFLSHLCPAVKRVTLVDTEQNLGLVMCVFKSMEDLRINVTGGSQNLDSIFCGLYSEEVAELEGKALDYLKTTRCSKGSIHCLSRELVSLCLISSKVTCFATGWI